MCWKVNIDTAITWVAKLSNWFDVRRQYTSWQSYWPLFFYNSTWFTPLTLLQEGYSVESFHGEDILTATFDMLSL